MSTKTRKGKHMDRDDIIRMAREAGIPTSEVVIKGNGTHLRSVDIERFAALVAAAEREAIIQAMPGGHSVDPQWVCDMIRARGNK